MKRLALFLVSLDEPVKDDSLLTDYVLPEILYASMSDDGKDSETRTYVGGEDGKDVLWHADDEISYFSGDTHANYVSQGAGDSSVEFIQGDKEQATVESAVDGTVAVYPYNSYNDPRIVEGKNVIYTMFPSIQTYAPDSFGKGANVMVAKSGTAGADNLYFRNACGYSHMTISNPYSVSKCVEITLPSSRG